MKVILNGDWNKLIMWYRYSQQVDIGLQNSPSALGPNTGIFASFAESEKLRKALDAGDHVVITGQNGEKILGLHGSKNLQGEYCGQISKNDIRCGQEFEDWLTQKGLKGVQVVTCQGGLLPNSLTNVKAPIQVGFPVAPDPTNPNNPIFVSVQK
jgi:hypothetical protein